MNNAIKERTNMITLKNSYKRGHDKIQVKAELTKTEVLTLLYVLSVHKEVSMAGCDLYNALITAISRDKIDLQ